MVRHHVDYTASSDVTHSEPRQATFTWPQKMTLREGRLEDPDTGDVYDVAPSISSEDVTITRPSPRHSFDLISD